MIENIQYLPTVYTMIAAHVSNSRAVGKQEQRENMKNQEKPNWEAPWNNPSASLDIKMALVKTHGAQNGFPYPVGMTDRDFRTSRNISPHWLTCRVVFPFSNAESIDLFLQIRGSNL